MKKLLFTLITFTSFSAIAEWKVSYEDIQIKDKFIIEEIYETYTGDSALNKQETEAKNGHKFVLIKINVQNDDPTIAPFNSGAFSLKTDKMTYERIDDTFLRDYNLKPFTRLKIKKGNHTGHLLFEVAEAELTKTPHLFYQDHKVQKVQ